MMGRFKNWLCQPSTISGLATCAGLLVAALGHLWLHDNAADASVGAVAFAAVHLIMNDNTAAIAARQLAEDVVAHAPASVLDADVAGSIAAVAKADLSEAAARADRAAQGK